jgi:serine/threonine protein kinase
LNDCEKRGDKIEKNLILKWLKQIILGLKDLHKNDYHQNLNPGFFNVLFFIIYFNKSILNRNIFIDNNNNLKLTGFGLTKILSNTSGISNFGYEIYRAPDTKITNKFDIWLVSFYF